MKLSCSSEFIASRRLTASLKGSQRSIAIAHPPFVPDRGEPLAPSCTIRLSRRCTEDGSRDPEEQPSHSELERRRSRSKHEMLHLARQSFVFALSFWSQGNFVKDGAT